MKVSIVGAAGAIGQSTAEALTARGVPVRLVGREAAKLSAMGIAGAEQVSADVATEEGCRRALRGVDAAVYTLGLPYTKRDFARYPVMMKTFLNAARAEGVRKVVLISNVYPYGLPRSARVSEDHPRVPVSVKGEYRKQQEDLLLAAHDPQGLRTLSLRLPNFYGPGVKTSLIDGLFAAAARGKRGFVFGPTDLPQELVFTPDVGPVIAELLQRDDAFGRPYNFAGAGVTSWGELARAIYAAAGHPAKFTVASPRMLKLMGVFSELMRELSEMSHLQTHPVLLDDTRLREVLPGLKKTPYAEGIARTLAAHARQVSPVLAPQPA